MIKQKNVKVVKILSVAIATLLFILAVVLIFQFIKISNLRAQQQSLQLQLNQLEQDIIHFSNENKYLESSDFIKDYAREVMGYGILGETRFR